MQQEGAAADAGGLRLDQPEHHLYGDRRIDRGTASRQHVVAGLRSERMRRRNDELARHHRFARMRANGKKKKGSRSCPFEEPKGVH